jgi:hypothetical protein
LRSVVPAAADNRAARAGAERKASIDEKIQFEKVSIRSW